MRRPFYWKERKGWFIRVPDSRGKLKTVRLGRTRSEADAEWVRMQNAAEAGDQPDEMAVVALIAQFTESLSRQVELGQLEQSTLTRRLDYLTSFCGSISESLTVRGLKPHHVSSWLNASKTWGATTQYHALEAVKGAVQWAADQELISRNPLARMKGKKGPPRDFLVSRSIYESLLAEVGRPKLKKTVRAFQQLLIALRHSGCRPGEVAAVRVEHVQNDTWVMAKHKNARKQQRPRVVYLSPCLQTLTRIAAHGRTKGPLFKPNPERGWQYSDMRRRFERLRKRRNVDKQCVLYSFRHTWITDTMIAGVDVATVAEMAGTSIQMIERHYGHLSQRSDHLKEAAVKASRFRVADQI